MAIIFKIIGALGVLLISAAILIKKEKTQDIQFVLGGLCLLTYSIHIQDLIFIILQTVFILTASYELVKIQFFKK